MMLAAENSASPKFSRQSIPFATGISVQEYLVAEEGLESVAAQGLSHWYIDASSAENNPDQWSKARVSSLLKRCGVAHVHPILHGNGQTSLGHEIAELRKASLDYVKREIKLAAEIRAPLIIHGGPYYATQKYGAVFDQVFANFLEELQEAAHFASEHDVEIWVENLPNYARPPFGVVCSSIEQMCKVVKIANVKAVVDLGHANIDGGDAIGMTSMLIDNLACISVSDNDGKSDGHLPPGAGNINYSAILSLLIAREWRGIVNIELHHGRIEDALNFLGDHSRHT